MGYRVGVDIGGSFTDFALFDEATQSLKTLKVFSRPDEPGAEVLEGVRLVGERYGIRPERHQLLHPRHHGRHQHRHPAQGVEAGAVHDRAFPRRARGRAPEDPGHVQPACRSGPQPLIPRDLVFGITGRLKADGSGGDDTRRGERRARGRGRPRGRRGGHRDLASCTPIAIPRMSLPPSAMVERLAPDIPVFLSSETWPIIREYERTITAVIGAYVQPRVAHYLGSLQAALKNAGVPAEPRLTKSNGGVMTAEQGKSQCVQMILSGHGVGRDRRRLCGRDQRHQALHQPRYRRHVGGRRRSSSTASRNIGVGETDRRVPDLHPVGLGELDRRRAAARSPGSTAQGVLKVGPESAGSRPGPACYGRGGTRATITDAFAALGLVGLSDIGYSAVTIDRRQGARGRRRAGRGARPHDRGNRGGDHPDCGLRHVLGYQRAGFALRRRSARVLLPRLRRRRPDDGLLPRARARHARDRRADRRRACCRALGGLIADIKSDFIKTLYVDLVPAAGATIRSEFETLKAKALDWLHQDQGYSGPHALIYSAEMRYRGQSFELDTVLDPACDRGGRHQGDGGGLPRRARARLRPCRSSRPPCR